MGTYQGAFHARYTNLSHSETLDEWVFEKIRAEIKRRIDEGEDFGMTVNEVRVDRRAYRKL